MDRFSLPLALALVSALLLTGCPESGPPVEYVEGIVTLDGKPVEGVTVSFSPVDLKVGSPAVGETDANGVYKLTATQGGSPGSGTKAGEYQVALSKVKVAGSGPEVTGTDDPNYGKSPNPKPAPTQVEYIIPQKYENATTSGLKVTVKDGTNKGGEFNFDVKKE